MRLPAILGVCVLFLHKALQQCDKNDAVLMCACMLSCAIRIPSSLKVQVQVQVQGLFVTYTIIQRVLTSSEMKVRSAPWTVQYYRKQHKEVYIKWNEKKKYI